MPTVLDVPGIIISSDIARQVSRRAVNGLCMEDRVALGRIVGVVGSSVFLNAAPAGGILCTPLQEVRPPQILPATVLLFGKCACRTFVVSVLFAAVVLHKPHESVTRGKLNRTVS